MNADDVSRAIHRGIKKANALCEMWSRGDWITDAGGEGHLVSRVAEEIWLELDDEETLGMEVPFSWIKENSGSKQKRGRPPISASDTQRADIVLYSNTYQFVAIVEMKRNWISAAILKDIDRISSLMSRYGPSTGGSLQYGFVGFSLPKQITGRSRDLGAHITEICGEIESVRYDGIQIRAGQGSKRWKLPQHYVEPEGTPWVGGSLVFEITPLAAI